jgi:catechol 2,3-dioxygenase-like lactoylglutathione lyase family enzyme
MTDRGLSHIALTVRDVARSIDFYQRFTGFEVVHQRGELGRRVVWLSDLELPFALVLVESATDDVRLNGVAHLGIACESRAHVDRLCDRARSARCLLREPQQGNERVGYWALLCDPDGHNVELSFGQEVGVEVRRARRRQSRRSNGTSPLVARGLGG